jgi:hypothetical protein
MRESCLRTPGYPPERSWQHGSSRLSIVKPNLSRLGASAWLVTVHVGTHRSARASSLARAPLFPARRLSFCPGQSRERR